MVKLFRKNVITIRQRYRQTDTRTERRHAIAKPRCTKVHRAVKTEGFGGRPPVDGRPDARAPGSLPESGTGTKFDFRRPRPAWGAYNAPPDSLTGLHGPTSKGGEGNEGYLRGRQG